MSSVKVGVRIRPLLSKERSQNASQTLQPLNASSVAFKNQQFTYDNVFGNDMQQEELYVKTAAPMLKSFMEGYNVTIMAYGQTGSGKTYTMGTAAATQGEDCQGLIPRFVTDLFENLVLSNENSDVKEEDATLPSSPHNKDGTETEKDSKSSEFKNKVTISFLEIYGEDVYDLLSNNASASVNTNERASLSVREDEKGIVFVQGQHEESVNNASEALHYLDIGTRNRITASTGMNSTSSRSHAVFTVTLDQVIQNKEDEDDVHHITSKLTFVDLAGSERVKRTGAEGQRLREGIQINSGLFNLGQVINSLADEQRIKQGLKAAHIPYRNSKLTHLLKDALGGNSQTLFLACVSPAESNESETYSTLCYARQARNIQNKPVKNMDQTSLEIRKLKLALKTWMVKACGFMYYNGNGALTAGEKGQEMTFSPSKESDMELLKCPEVVEYIQQVNSSISDKLKEDKTTPRKVRLSFGLSPLVPKGNAVARRRLHNTFDEISVKGDNTPTPLGGAAGRDALSPAPIYGGNGRRGSMLHTLQTMSHGTEHVLEQQEDPEETEKLVTRMLEMVNKEKEVYGNEKKQVEDDAKAAEIVDCEREIDEKQQILGKLMETVKGYNSMKMDFERLLDEIGSLELERKNLEMELERAKKEGEKAEAAGHGHGHNSGAVDRIRERFHKVKRELDTMREERKQKETAYRLMQREQKQCDSLTREIKKLRDNRLVLVKSQKVALAAYQKREKEAQQKLNSLRNVEAKKTQRMNKMKNDIVIKDRVLGHKDKEINRINNKLRTCEEHIAQLLRIQNRNRNRLNQVPSKGRAGTSTTTRNTIKKVENSNNSLTADESRHLASSTKLLNDLIADRVENSLMRTQYDIKSSALQDLNNEMIREACEMESLLTMQREIDVDANAIPLDLDVSSLDLDEAEAAKVNEYVSIQRNISICEANIDRITRELDIYNADIDNLNERIERQEEKLSSKEGKNNNTSSSWEELGREIVEGFNLAQFRVLLWDVVSDQAGAREEARCAREEIKRLKDQLEGAQDRTADSERMVKELRGEMKQKLELAEKQRVQDVWAVINAKPSDNSGSDTDQDKSTDIVESTALKIAMQRAHELEEEVETLMTEKAASEQQAEYILKLEKEREDLRLQLGLASVTFDDDTGNEDSEKGWNALIEGNSFENIDPKFTPLQQLWSDIGIDLADRENMVTELRQASNNVHQKMVSQMQSDHDKYSKECSELQSDLEVMCQVIGCEMKEYYSIDGDSHSEGKITVLKKLHLLRTACDNAEKVFCTKADELSKTKELLLDLVNEMWLDTNDLSPSLQQLIKIVINESVSFDLARRLKEHNLVLTQQSLATWDSELRKLNVTRATCTKELIAVRNKALKLGNSLDILNEKELALVCKEMPSNDLSAQSVQGAIEMLTSTSRSNPPGSQSLLVASERLLLLLESVAANRRSAGKCVKQFIHSYTSIIQSSTCSTPHTIEHEDRHETDTHVFSRSELTGLIDDATGISQHALDALPQLNADISTLMVEIDSVAHADPATCQENIHSLVDKYKAHDPGNKGKRDSRCLPQEYISMLQCVADARPIATCTEEGWLCLLLKQWFHSWSTDPDNAMVEAGLFSASKVIKPIVSKKDKKAMESDKQGMESNGHAMVLEAIVLHRECMRLIRLRESYRELVTLDSTLAAHVKEMEDFESQSKQDRARVLKGNSTALLAEEKFRRNGKKKYEFITDKILEKGGMLQQLLSGANISESANGEAKDKESKDNNGSAETGSYYSLPVTLNLSILSARGHELLRGRRMLHQERSELMHLHTLARVERRWSGDKDDREAEQNKENSPDSDRNASASGSTSSSKVQPPLAPTDRTSLSNKRTTKSSALPKAPVSTRSSGPRMKSVEYVSGRKET